MWTMEGMIEDQAERIITLEEEVAILQTKKVCKCGKGEASLSRAGTQEDLLDVDLEYAKEEDSSSSGSYHTPLRVFEEPSHIFRSPISQCLPKDVQTTCGCPVPDIIRIEDDVELIAVPQENERPIPICVEELLRYNMGVQCAS